MNDHESAAVLGILTAAWPNLEVNPATAQLWMGMLAELDPADAMVAARAVVRQEHWFPSVARYLQAADAARRARNNREAADRGLPEPVGRSADEGHVHEIVGRLRSRLAARGARGHWHGGPEPCPVCGGIAPPKVSTGGTPRSQP